MRGRQKVRSGHQLVGTLQVEYAASGICAFNVQRGFVGTERNELAVREYGKTL
ncbi:MAG: hypothetical protein Q8R44_05390 [Novosphingobium sp.]|nr:hypothetical protein [Novosphingobium sp.]